jgi:hypothetical protein
VSIRESRLCDYVETAICPQLGTTCPGCGLDRCAYHFGYGRVVAGLSFIEQPAADPAPNETLEIKVCRLCMSVLHAATDLRLLEDDIVKVIRAYLAAKSLEPKELPK